MDEQTKLWGQWFFMITVLVVVVLVLSGCASYTIKDGEGKILSQGTATGFLRTITVTEKYKDGKITERRISTDSNTKEVLMGLESFIDTTVNTVDKIKP